MDTPRLLRSTSLPLPVKALQQRRLRDQLRANAPLVPMLAWSLVRGLLRRRRDILFELPAQVWIDLLRYLAPNVRPVHVRDLGLDGITVEGAAGRYDRIVLCALCQKLGCRAVFEIGTLFGQTTWLLAHNSPSTHVYTLDLPDPDAVYATKFDVTDPEYFESWDRGIVFHGTSEEARITQLWGDSARFDFTPYEGKIDLVFVDGSHGLDYVRSDTEAAMSMLSPEGTIVWDDYTHYPTIYRYLNQLSARLDRPVIHLRETRLAVYSRRPLLV